MKVCPQCGKTLTDDTVFCEGCGTKLPENAPAAPVQTEAAPVCPQCGAVIEAGTAFCTACGAKIAAEEKKAPVAAGNVCPQCGAAVEAGTSFCTACGAQIPQSEKAAAPAKPAADVMGNIKKAVNKCVDKMKALPKKLYLYGGIGLAAVLVIVLLVVLLAGSGTKYYDYALYLESGQIMLNDYSDAERVTNSLYSDMQTDDIISNRVSRLSSYISKSANGRILFYPDRLSYNGSSSVTLYCRDITDMEEDPVRIDTDVYCYSINEDGSKVIYLKSDGGLYIHDLEEKEKIASNVSGFMPSENLKTVVYVNNERSIYVWRSGKETEKLASEVDSVNYVSDDMKTVYYTKNGTLYKQVVGEEEREEIVKDIERIVNIYESGKFYFVTAETKQINLMDYVIDSMAASDAAMQEPEWPDYPDYPDYPSRPYRYQFDTTEEYEAAYDQYLLDVEEYERICDEMESAYDAAVDAYNEDQDAWYEKEDRDYLRESLNDYSFEHITYTLYYFDGEEKIMISDALADDYFEYAMEAPVAVVEIYNQADVTKVDLSEVEYAYEVQERVQNALSGSSELAVVAEETLQALEVPYASYNVLEDGTGIYLYESNEDSYIADVYFMAVSGDKIEKEELYDSDVYNSYHYTTEDGKLMYYKNVNTDNRSGDLYIGKEEVDFDVRLGKVTVEGGSVFYLIDWSDDSECGTLKMYRNGDKTKIADDVHTIQVVGEKEVLYLRDYGTTYGKGTLYRFTGSKSAKLADDVSGILAFNEELIKG